MARRRIGVVVCALAVVAMAGGATAGREAPGVPAAPAVQRRGPEIAGNTDGRHVWMHAEYKGLLVRKLANRSDRTLSIDLRYRLDAVTVAIDKAGVTSVRRGGQSVAIDSPGALEQAQRVLAGSEAVFAIRALLAERQAVSDLKAPEYTLLATAAFVASLVGDTDAPARLADRFVEKHRGIVRPVRNGGCWSAYTQESTSAWNDLQACMDEANQDDSWFNGAYRRLACNGVWILRSESAWFEYLECLSPLAISGDEVP